MDTSDIGLICFYTEDGRMSPGIIDWFEFLEGFYEGMIWLEE